MPRWRPSPEVWQGGLLAVAVAAAYGNALGASFQFDDFQVIVGAPAVQGWAPWVRDLPHGLRPLLKLSYLLNWKLGAGAVGFHAVNVVIHLANVLLFHRLAKPLAGPGAFWAALVFALHPAQTEAVTYACGRSVSLMTLFALLSLRSHTLTRDGASGWRSALWFLAALLTRETALMLPALLLLWDWQRGRAWRWSLRALRVHLVLVASVLLALPFHPGYRAFFRNSLQLRTLWENLQAQAVAVPYLLGRVILSWRLNFDPDLRADLARPAEVAAGACLVLLLMGGAWWGLRRRSLWGVAILWVFLNLSPTNSIFPRRDLANDRHLYLALGGPALLAGAWLAAAPGRDRRRWVALSVILACGVLTILRNQQYRTEITLWEATAGPSPLKPRVHNNLGYAYALAGRRDQAHAEYLKALALDPNYRLAAANLRNLDQADEEIGHGPY